MITTFLFFFFMSAGWKRVSDRRAHLGESEGILLVARNGDALENQVGSSGSAAGGVVWRRDVLRGQKQSAQVAETVVEWDFYLYLSVADLHGGSSVIWRFQQVFLQKFFC